MSELMLTEHAYNELMHKTADEQSIISKALLWLRENPNLGLRLWGSYDHLYLYQAPANLKIIYRVAGERIVIVTIEKAIRYSPPPRDKISAIVLAAGRADYQNMPLQLLPIEGIPMIIKVIRTFLNADIDEVIVVLGYYAATIKRRLEGENVKVIINPHYQGPLSKSLKYGLRMVTSDTSAIALALGNQPFISSDIINELIAVYKKERANIVVPTYQGGRGHPVICDTSLIPELLKTRGNVGGREVIGRHKNELKEIESSEKSVITRISGIWN